MAIRRDDTRLQGEPRGSRRRARLAEKTTRGFRRSPPSRFARLLKGRHSVGGGSSSPTVERTTARTGWAGGATGAGTTTGVGATPDVTVLELLLLLLLLLMLMSCSLRVGATVSA